MRVFCSDGLVKEVKEALEKPPDGIELYYLIDPDESTWTIERQVENILRNGEKCDILDVCLIKVKPGPWPSLFKDLFCPFTKFKRDRKELAKIFKSLSAQEFAEEPQA